MPGAKAHNEILGQFHASLSQDEVLLSHASSRCALGADTGSRRATAAHGTSYLRAPLRPVVKGRACAGAAGVVGCTSVDATRTLARTASPSTPQPRTPASSCPAHHHCTRTLALSTVRVTYKDAKYSSTVSLETFPIRAYTQNGIHIV